MQKSIITVLSSFFGVVLAILIGTNIAYRTNVMPTLEAKMQEERTKNEEIIAQKDERIIQLEEELNIAIQKQQKAEDALKEKLAEEERIRLEKERQAQAARVAAAKQAAEAARVAAAKEKASKKSKAS